MQLVWKIFRKVSYYIEFISFTFIILFIWESKQELFPILAFSGLFFAFSPVGSFISTLLTNRISPKITLLISSALITIQLFIFIISNEDIMMMQLALVGIIGGLASGIKTVAEYVFERMYESENQEYRIQATKAFWGEVIKLITILTSAYLVSTLGTYTLLFQFILVALVANTILITLLSRRYGPKSHQIDNVFHFPGSNPQKHIIAKSEFVDGIYEGINVTILPIALFLFVGDILDWGLVQSLLLIIAICVTLILAKWPGKNAYKSLYGLTSFLFPAISIFVILNYNIFVLLAYMLMMTLNEVSGLIGYNTTVEEIIDQDPHKHGMLPEYKLFTETFYEIGRSLPMLVLLVIGLDINNDYLIQAALILGSILPILVMSILGDQLIYEKKENTEAETITA